MTPHLSVLGSNDEPGTVVLARLGMDLDDPVRGTTGLVVSPPFQSIIYMLKVSGLGPPLLDHPVTRSSLGTRSVHRVFRIHPGILEVEPSPVSPGRQIEETLQTTKFGEK